MASGRREVNDYRRRMFGREPQRVVAFVCECDDERCRRAVLLTAAEYDRARAAGRSVVVDSSHGAGR
jgi:redox-regulated HSP33 family molecular chaperone